MVYLFVGGPLHGQHFGLGTDILVYIHETSTHKYQYRAKNFVIPKLQETGSVYNGPMTVFVLEEIQKIGG